MNRFALAGWLGRLGSNQRMRESKSRAVPLGYYPIWLVFPSCQKVELSSFYLQYDWRRIEDSNLCLE